jgi:predicted NAD/FAD-dependent oxidoreductase
MTHSIAVIGAGVAGLTIARRLVGAGFVVAVFDKGRGVGGRLATRRTDVASFDHGAQYFTIRDPAFRSFLDQHLPPDAWGRWDGRFGSLEGGRLLDETRTEPRHVGIPGMSAVARGLAEGLRVTTGLKVSQVVGSPGQWLLVDDHETQHGPFDWVIATAPPTQSANLFTSLSPIAVQASTIVMEPCFAVMIGPGDGRAFPRDGIRCDHPALAWAANNHSKPGRGEPHALVIHSSPVWAREHLEDDPAAIAGNLQGIAGEAFGVDLRNVESATVHRWLYARPAEPMGQPFLIDRDARVAIAGDWCVAAKVEGAFRSGDACARGILESYA